MNPFKINQIVTIKEVILFKNHFFFYQWTNCFKFFYLSKFARDYLNETV